MEGDSVATTVLAKVLNVGKINPFIISDVNYSAEFLVIPGNGAPRWIIPADARLGRGILTQWRPYGLSSKIKWSVLLTFYKFRLLSKIPKIQIISALQNEEVGLHKIDHQVLRRRNEVVPVIYVGTPGPQQKAVVTLIDIKSKAPLAIMKIPLGEQAKKSIIREANMLAMLPEIGVGGGSSVLTVDEHAGVSLQTVLSGKLSPREFTLRHLGWLLSLPTAGEKFTFDEQKKKLVSLYSSAKFEMTLEQKESINNALLIIEGEKYFDLILTHGDFAPWNIKKEKYSKLKVFDWEDARVNGFPLWDICHFYFIQAHLFNENKRIADLLSFFNDSNSLIQTYLNKKKIISRDAKKMVLLYVLFTVLNENTDSEYIEFLIKKIPVVINS